MKHKDSETIIEIEYYYKNTQSNIFRIILIMGLLIPIICTLYITILSIIFIKNQILFITTISLFLILIYFAYHIIFKIKIICKLTNKGIIFQNKMFHHLVKWENISSYIIKNEFILLKTKGWKYVGLGFPINHKKKQIINILNFYIKK